MKDLTYIEEYIKYRKYNMAEFDISCDATLDGEIKYWARFSMTDDENDDYTDFVQANGSSFEEVVSKIAKYLKGGKHYKDGRYIQ